MNVVVGQNNVGKTAFLESFRLFKNSPNPHRGLYLGEGDPLPAQSIFNVGVSLTGKDIFRWALEANSFWIATEDQSSEAAWRTFRTLMDDGATTAFRVAAQGGFEWLSWPPHSVFVGTGDRSAGYFTADRVSQTFSLAATASNENDFTPSVLQNTYERKVFIFRAERYNIGKVALHDTSVLSPDASNLPAVLAKLNRNARVFSEYARLVRHVLPSIDSISVSQTGSEVEIFIYNVNTMRPDLAMELRESGTGVAQVLAIVYVLMTLRDGVIIIDEPNSFLHPGAAKKLIQLLALFPTNQYIVSTHAPELISASGVDKVIQISMVEGESVVSELNTNDMDHVKGILSDVGSTLGDVFGLDAVIWVEGQTEQECFPLIMRGVSEIGVVGVSFVAMRHTGDFDKRRRDPREPWEIYARLSSGTSLVPPAVAFSFDLDGRTEKQIEDMKRQSRGRAHFILRRTYENYLLHPAAISAVLGAEMGREVIVSEVEAALLEFMGAHSPSSIPDEVGCHAPSVLEDVFSRIGGGGYNFDKMTHSLSITRWLIDNDPGHLAEIAAFISGLVPAEFREAVGT